MTNEVMNQQTCLSEHFTLGELCKTSVKAENVPEEKEIGTKGEAHSETFAPRFSFYRAEPLSTL